MVEINRYVCMKQGILLSILLFASSSCDAQNSTEMSNEQNSFEVAKSEQEWQKQLSAEEYYVSGERNRASIHGRIQYAF